MQLDGPRGVESHRELKIARRKYRGAIKRCPQQSDLDGSRIYQAYRNFLDGLKSCRAAIDTDYQNIDGSKLR